MDDVRTALAFAARRSGKRAAAPAEWAHILSLELGWMSPKEAKAFVQGAVEAGLLTTGTEATLTFDAASVEVPRGFRPDAGARAGTTDPFLGWVDRLAERRGVARDAVLADVAAAQEAAGGLLEAEAAVLRLAAQAGMDVSAAAEAALSRLRGRSRGR